MLTGATEEIRNRHDMVTGVIEGTHNGPDMGTRGSEEIRNGHDKLTGSSEKLRNGHDKMTGVQKKSLCGPDMVIGGPEEIRQYTHMVTRVQEEIRYRPHMVTGVTEEIPSCSPGISSGKRKKAQSTSQPQFRSEKTPATIEADQILWALQQFATNSISAKYKNNNSRLSRLPKSLTTTRPTFDRKSKMFELFEDLFQLSSKIHNQLTEEDKKTTSFLSCVVMRCRRSKTSAGTTDRM